MDHLLILLIVLLLLLIIITSLGGSLSPSSPPTREFKRENFVQKTRKRSPVKPFNLEKKVVPAPDVETFEEQYQHVDGLNISTDYGMFATV